MLLDLSTLRTDRCRRSIPSDPVRARVDEGCNQNERLVSLVRVRLDTRVSDHHLPPPRPSLPHSYHFAKGYPLIILRAPTFPYKRCDVDLAIVPRHNMGLRVEEYLKIK